MCLNEAAHTNLHNDTSMLSAINFLKRSQLSRCRQEEVRAFPKRINRKRASGFEVEITQALREAWGLSFEDSITPNGRV
jgi:hypothetical protein